MSPFSRKLKTGRRLQKMDSDETQNSRNDEVANDDFEQGETDDVADERSPPRIPSAERPQFRRTFSPRETCVCPSGKNITANANDVVCPSCGKFIDKTTRSEATSSSVLVAEESAATSSSDIVALNLTLANGLVFVPQTPETSLEVNTSTTDDANTDTSQNLRTMSQAGNKIPVEGQSDSSVPVPCPPLLLTYYVLKRDYLPANEMTFSLHVVENSKQERVASFVRQMEQQGIHVVSFGDEYSTQQEHKHFHTLCLEDRITVKFQLLKLVQRRFRLREEQETFQVPLMRIKSLCQNRIPGSIAQIHIEPLCEPGEVCQDHLRMTLDTGQTIHSMLIPIWSSRPS